MMVSHSLSGVGITDCGLSDVEPAWTRRCMHGRRMCGLWQVYMWSAFVMWICAFLCTLINDYFRPRARTIRDGLRDRLGLSLGACIRRVMRWQTSAYWMCSLFS